MSIRDRVDNIINTHGQTITYRRVIGQTRNSTTMKKVNSFSEDEVKAHVRFYKAKELEGLIQHGDREVRISAKSLSFTPAENDEIIISSNEYNIKSVDTREDTGDVLIHVLQIRGRK